MHNIQPTVLPLERVQLLGVENLCLMRLIRQESSLVHGDSSLSQSYQPDVQLAVGKYDPLHIELEMAPGRVGFIVHKSFYRPSGQDWSSSDTLSQGRTLIYNRRGDPQYYVQTIEGRAFVKKANYDEKGTRIGRAREGDRARYPESSGYRIVDGEVWQIETVFVNWGNLMSVHVSDDGHTLRFYRGFRPDEANLTATVRRTGTIENWVDHLEEKYFQGTGIQKEAYLGDHVSVTNGVVTWHRHPGDELLLNSQLSPESFILFSVVILGDPWVGGIPSQPYGPGQTRPFVYGLGEFQVRLVWD